MPADSRASEQNRASALRRVAGATTTALLGIGVAVGSGIFINPKDVAKAAYSPSLILLAWALGGLLTLGEALVTAELATRFPRAGGEYQYLKEAYGRFAAFFFGWSYTIFIIAGGAATIAAALGNFAIELTGGGVRQPQAIACTAIVLVTAINAAGLKTGAVTQNLLTITKVLALIAIAVGCTFVSGTLAPSAAPSTEPHHSAWLGLLAAMIPVMWSYSGVTDSAKISEEMRDVRRNLPRALIASTLVVTAVYLVYNFSLLRAMPATEMAAHAGSSIPATIAEQAGLPTARRVVLAISIIVCFGSLSSSILATIRVTFAMARDGLAFAPLARMSPNQAPIAALVAAAAVACLFVLSGSFEQLVTVYYTASAILFGLSDLSLIVFRVRERRAGPAPDVYRVRFGIAIATLLVIVQLAVAANAALYNWRVGRTESLWTFAILAALAACYPIWRRGRAQWPAP